MRRFNLALLVSLKLCGARARQPGFSVHEDLLAHPQFEVVFSDIVISEHDAQALVSSADANAHPTYAADFTSQSDLSNQIREATPAESEGGAQDDDDDEKAVSETYEIMNVPPEKYLCAIPVLAPPAAPNHTANELAKAEEARELDRASTKGWQLMNRLDGQCLYFVSGWWSYSFCYNREIVQFHALPSTVKGGPPVRDPQSQEFVLGRVPHHKHHPSQRNRHAQQQPLQPANRGPQPANTELLVKGDQRYLVQRLDGGTTCDLTGKERTIEVQYHCLPGLTTERIAWIKEVTICTYLMLVQTPRLCNEVAFLPPRERRAHPITCRPILGSDEEVAAWHKQKSLAAHDALVSGAQSAKDAQKSSPKTRPSEPLMIGGLVVGGLSVLGKDENGKPAAKLTPPRNFVTGRMPGGPIVEILASAKSKADGGRVEVLSDEELEKLDLNPETVEDLRKQIEKYAGDKGWKLEVVEVPGEVPEIRGVVETEDDEEEEGSADGEFEYDEFERYDGYDEYDGYDGYDGYDDAQEGAEEDGGSEENFFANEL